MKKLLIIVIPALIVVLLMFLFFDYYLHYRTYNSTIGKARVEVYADTSALINCLIPFGTRFDEHGGKAYFYDINGKHFKTEKLYFLRALNGVRWDADGNPTEVGGTRELFGP